MTITYRRCVTADRSTKYVVVRADSMSMIDIQWNARIGKVLTHLFGQPVVLVGLRSDGGWTIYGPGRLVQEVTKRGLDAVAWMIATL